MPLSLSAQIKGDGGTWCSQPPDGVQLALPQPSRWFVFCNACTPCSTPRVPGTLMAALAHAWLRFCRGGADHPPRLTFYGLPVHQPLYRGLGVPVGSANQPAVLTRGQNEVLGLVQPVRSSFKTHKRSGYTRSKPDQMVPRGSNPNHFVCCEQMQPESGAHGSHCL